MKKSIGTRSAQIVAIVVGFFALLITSDALLKNIRLDLTENRIYTLTEGTHAILESLKDPINIYLFFSEKASQGQSSLRTYHQRIKEVLEEYESYAGGQLIIHHIDPEPFSEEEDRATELGITAAQNEKGDPLYFGIAATNSVDDLEVIPFLQPKREVFFEYDLNKIIYSLKRLDKPALGLLSSINMYAVQGNPQLGGANTATWGIIQQLERLFEIRLVDLETQQIDPEIDVLLVVHPRNFSEETLYAIDQHILGGGNGMFFVDPYAESVPPQKAPRSPGLADHASTLNRLFRAWGDFWVTEHFLIGDFKQALTVSNSAGNRVRHPAMLGLSKNLLAQDDVVMYGLNSINMATASYLEKGDDQDIEYKALITSSDQAVSVSNRYLNALANPELLRQVAQPDGTKYILASRVKGLFKSAFPQKPEGSSYQKQHLQRAEQKANIVIVADTDILSDRLWSQAQNFFGHRIIQAFASNRDFVVGLVDNMLGSDELVGTRSKVSYVRPFTRVKALEAKANQLYYERHKALSNKLSEAEAKLRQLQEKANEDNAVSFSMEKKRQVAQYQQEAIKTRKDLREVRHQLSQNIETLGRNLKIVNIVLVPALVALLALVIAYIRIQKRKRQA